jgi:hypothetical protein
MKSVIISFVVLLGAVVAVKAQPTVSLLTFGGYTLSDKFDTEYGSGRIDDGFQWGAGLELGVRPTTALELIYQTMKTTADYQAITKHPTGDVGINYLMLGGTKYAPFSDVVSGFGSFDAGVGWFNPSASLESSTVTKFSIGGRLGLAIKTSEKVSIRLHAQVLSPVQWAGGGFYFGTGGAGTGISTGSTIWQFNFGGSLNFRIK